VLKAASRARQIGQTSATRQGPDDNKTLKDLNFQVMPVALACDDFWQASCALHVVRVWLLRVMSVAPWPAADWKHADCGAPLRAQTGDFMDVAIL
jgi:hypothetical protein